MVKLINVSSLVEADQIITLLGDNEIEAFKSSAGAGGYLSVIGNYSTVGYDIMVDESALEKANNLIQELYEGTDSAEFDVEDTVSSAGFQFRKLAIRISAIVVLAVGLLFAILSVVF